MRHTCFHVALEPIPSRYSEQWLWCLKLEFEKYAGHDWTMLDILGAPVEGSDKPTPGVFLNLTATNAWKASQVAKLSHLFAKGYVTPGDVFLFTDAWNPAILNVRYMADLMKIPVRIVSMWHAGSYDPWDYLGYTIKNKEWSKAAELSFFEASDVNVFATEFHKNLFIDGIIPQVTEEQWDKIVISGQPHYEIIKTFENLKHLPKKEDIIVFPHRIGPEKQPEIFDEMAKLWHSYRFLKLQTMNLNKAEYYDYMLRSKISFSCSLQETLGISQMEAVLAGTVPLMPDSLSYVEMYDPVFLYDSRLIQVDNRKPSSDNIRNLIILACDIAYDSENHYWQERLRWQKEKLIRDYLTCTPMFNAIIGEK